MMKKYLFAAAVLLALGRAAHAIDLQALQSYDSCMDRFAPWQDAGSRRNLDGWSYCQDRYDQDRATNRRLQELEDNEN